MIQRARLGGNDYLDAIVRAIVDGVRPNRVILFGSRARGDARSDSDYDVVVELGFDQSDRSAATNRVRDALRAVSCDVLVDINVRQPGEIESKRDDPGFVDWDIARDGIILYPPAASSGSLRPSRPRPRAVRERGRPASIKVWLEFIDQDLRVIEMSLSAGTSAAWGAAGFHAQQAAEKYLKILFIQAGERPPRTHRLDTLLDRLRTIGYDLPLFAEECALLNEYAVSIRYPEQLPIPSESGGRAVIAAAQRIMEAAKGCVKR